MTRLAFFSDAVFAVALVINVIHLAVPAAYVPSDTLHDELGDIVPSIIGFGITFAVIGVLWVDHHRLFDHLRARDEAFLWLNGAFLLCVAFLPFAAGTVTKHMDAPVAVLLFTGSMFITGVVWLVVWWYASSRGLLDPGLTSAERRRIVRQGGSTPVIFAISAALAPAVVDIGGDGYSLAIAFWVAGLVAVRLKLLRTTRPSS